MTFLFGSHLRVTFTDKERARFMRPLRPGQWGGQQRFIDGLQQRVNDGGLEVSEIELRQAERYAYRYGDGGWQGYSRVLIEAAKRSGYVRDDSADAVSA